MGRKRLTWANVDLEDEEEVDRFEEQELDKAGERTQKAVKELGIVDEKGWRTKKELPPDMQPNSQTAQTTCDSEAALGSEAGIEPARPKTRDFKSSASSFLRR